MNDIPKEFIVAQLPNNQREMIVDKWIIFQHMNDYTGLRRRDAYYDLSEKLHKDVDTIRNLHYKINKNMSL